LISKDFRANPSSIVFVRIRKETVCSLSLCSLREQTKSSELAAGGAAENQGEKKKAALRPPRAMEIPYAYYQRIPYSVKKNAIKCKNGTGKRRKSEMAGPIRRLPQFLQTPSINMTW
jgi:hypothetical protein